MPKTSVKRNDKFINVWDKVEIIFNEADKKGIYISRIEDIGKDFIIASRPDFVKGTGLLRDNSQIYVQYKRPDALYRFAANLKQISGDIDGSVRLSSLGKIERVQRREYVRIEKGLDLKYSVLKNSTSGFLLDQLIWHESRSKNISAGGMLIKENSDIKEGDILLMRINEYEIIGMPRFICTVCHRRITIDDFTYIGMEFITRKYLKTYFRSEEIKKLPPLVKRFDAHIQNKMVNYIFEEQIKERQKGLI
jgi:c-di-GMP-binding flagellar brake protein YcgR